MSNIGKMERVTQNRVIELFQNELGYRYLGNWEERPNNSNIEESILRENLLKRGYNETLVNRAIYELKNASINYHLDLYNNNKNVYHLLRYGAEVHEDAGDRYERVQFIEWDPKKIEENDFAIAEEVTIQSEREKRPDIVIYVNGIALGVIELKRSIVSIGDGIRQSLVNQQREFIESFFNTVQFVFAGNDTEGLKYGSIKTPEKYFLKWKEDVEDTNHLQIDKYLLKLCEKRRFLEIIYDFVLFDGGTKKLPRHHQYFAVKAAQEHIKRNEGGIIWHTQGSGKSIVMVWLAKWILENKPNARVVVITDREELDKQIRDVFTDSGEEIYRTSSGKDLLKQLALPKPRLLCSLVHKFGRRGVANFDEFIEELKSQPSKIFGEVFVFVDECHRTQSGKMHKTMKAIMQNAVFIGFTGTPLLKQDKQTSLEVFGKYIHTYKFNEAVDDEVVKDLVYEPRDIDQKLTSPEKIDEWFEIKTKGLNDFQKSELKKKWGTMQALLSSINRMKKVVSDIVFDFNVKPRLSSGNGNAILIAARIYDACRYFELFNQTEFAGKCAVITSYNPSIRDITTEDTGTNTETEKEYVYRMYDELLKDTVAEPNKSKSETYEDKAKRKFIEEPANMKLLIVVDKLLTGFDAPPCSYLYIDKKMKDHGLFQAICRVNRLDSEDKDFGYIVDYKDLFNRLINEEGTGAIQVYTSELDYDKFLKQDCDILMQNRLEKGKERLEKAMEQLGLLCEPVEMPKDTMAFIRFFCGNPEKEEDLKSKEFLRVNLYKYTVALIRAYANIAGELDEAGFTEKEKEYIKKQIDHYLKLREEIRKASGETLDMKTYEADMRHLLDTYVEASDSRSISPFGNLSLLDIIDNIGIIDAIGNLPEGIKNNQEAIAETIENNVRQKIIREHLLDPAFFEEISKLLSELVKQRKTNAVNYEEYLKKMASLIKMIKEGTIDTTPYTIKTPAQKALYNNLGKNEKLTLELHKIIMEERPDHWKGESTKEEVVKGALYKVLKDVDEVERIFTIVKQQNEY